MLGPVEIADLLAAAEDRARDAQGRVARGKLRARVLRALGTSSDGVHLMTIARECDRSKHVIDTVLTRLMAQGRVRRLRRGVSAPAEAA